MIVALAALLFATPIEEAEHALAAGRIAQVQAMIAQLRATGETGPRFDRLRAAALYESGQFEEALAIEAARARADPGDAEAAERAALAAFRLGRREEARGWLASALANPAASWRSWNLCGALADGDGRFKRADECYARALTLAPDRMEVLANRGWSLLLRGRWSEAAEALRTAEARAPGNPVIRANLDLALAATATALPVRRAGEGANDYAARLNDAGVMAAAAGDSERAVAAFANALTLRSSWSERTARNLADAQKK